MSQGPRRDVLETLERFSSLLSAGDRSVASVFAPDDDTLMAGSELRDLTRGPDELRSHLDAFLEMSGALAFEWRDRQATILGDAAWIFAEGEVILRDADGEQRSPYRLTVVLEKRNETWLWRHFHGSEPRPDR